MELTCLPACTEEGRDFRNNYYKTLIQTDFYDCMYVYIKYIYML